jgi:hypothetical protein
MIGFERSLDSCRPQLADGPLKGTSMNDLLTTSHQHLNSNLQHTIVDTIIFMASTSDSRN